MNPYTMCISELKSNFIPQIINQAIRVWKGLSFSNEAMSAKIDELQGKLERATKNEFIAVLKYYNLKVEEAESGQRENNS